MSKSPWSLKLAVAVEYLGLDEEQVAKEKRVLPDLSKTDVR